MKLLSALIFLSVNLCLAQDRMVKFNIVYKKDIAMPAVNIILKDSNPVVGTQTDLKGYAEMKVPDRTSTIILSFLAPMEPRFEITNTVDSISINLSRKNAIYFSGKRRIKKVSLKY